MFHFYCFSYSSLARWYPLGRATSGVRSVPALELSADLRRSHLKPAILFVGGVASQGDLLSSQLLLALADHLLSHAGGLDDEVNSHFIFIFGKMGCFVFIILKLYQVTRVLDEFSVHIVPAAYPDSLEGMSLEGCDGAEKKSNDRLEDFVESGGFSRRETRLLGDLLEERRFVLVVELRGGQAEGVVIPQGAAVGDRK